MTTLAGIRHSLEELLTTPEATAIAHIPETITPPAILITPADPYLVNGDTFGTWTIALIVLLIADSGASLDATDALDTLLADALAKLAADDWTIGDTAQPHTITINGNAHLCTAIDITATITL